MMPLSGASVYDFVIDKDSKLWKVQVKAAYYDEGNTVIGVRRPSAANRQYEEGHYDLLYAIDLDKRVDWLIPWKSIESIKSKFKPYKKEFDKWCLSSRGLSWS